MDRTWEVDEGNTVVAHFGHFGKKVITVNGNEVHSSRSLRTKGDTPFSLPDGRSGVLSVTPEFMGAPTVELRVGGNLAVETGKEAIACRSCGALAKPYDRFCGKCGKPMPTAEDYALQKHVKSATRAVKWLAVLFVFYGVLSFFATKVDADRALTKIQGLEETVSYPTPIDGRIYTIGELRRELAWEPWAVLLVNLILAAIMVALAFWAKRKPLAAVLVATATYVVVIVASAISDPRTLAQGWILKLIIIGLLIKGIKAGLALRSARA